MNDELDGQLDGHLNAMGWRARGFGTSRGFGARAGSDMMPEEIIGLTLEVEDTKAEGGISTAHFLFAPHEAEELANALLDSVRKHRAGES